MAPPGRQKRRCLPIAWPSLDKISDWLVDAIVGKELADKRAMALYEKKMAFAEERNRMVTVVTREVCEPIVNPTKDSESDPLLARTASVAHTVPKMGQIKVLTVPDPIHPPADFIFPEPTGIPDLSAADLTDAQLARVYSAPCLGNVKDEDLPPPPRMVSTGRFRRVAGTSTEWQIKNYSEDLRRLGPDVLDRLGDFPLAQFNDGVMSHIRSLSKASKETRTSFEEPCGPTIVCRGFNVGKPLLAPKDHDQQRDPTRYAPVLPARNTRLPIRRMPSFYPVNHGTSPLATHQDIPTLDPVNHGPSPLATVQEVSTLKPKKKAVPCQFNSESAGGAVFDDDDEDDVNDSAFESCQTSAVSSKVEESNMLKKTAVPGLQENKDHKPQVTLPPKPHVQRANCTANHGPEKTKFGNRRVQTAVARKVTAQGLKTSAARHPAKENLPKVETPEKAATIDADNSSSESISPARIFTPGHLQISSSESADILLDLTLEIEKARDAMLAAEKLSILDFPVMQHPSQVRGGY